MFNSIDSALRVFTKAEKRLQRAVETHDKRRSRVLARMDAMAQRAAHHRQEIRRAQSVIAKIQGLVN